MWLSPFVFYECPLKIVPPVHLIADEKVVFSSVECHQVHRNLKNIAEVNAVPLSETYIYQSDSKFVSTSGLFYLQ